MIVRQIDSKLLEAIKEIISKGERAEIVPAKDGVRLYIAKRREYKDEKNPQKR